MALVIYALTVFKKRLVLYMLKRISYTRFKEYL
jgi:hypothetical protein